MFSDGVFRVPTIATRHKKGACIFWHTGKEDFDRAMRNHVVSLILRDVSHVAAGKQHWIPTGKPFPPSTTPVTKIIFRGTWASRDNGLEGRPRGRLPGPLFHRYQLGEIQMIFPPFFCRRQTQSCSSVYLVTRHSKFTSKWFREKVVVVVVVVRRDQKRRT